MHFLNFRDFRSLSAKESTGQFSKPEVPVPDWLVQGQVQAFILGFMSEIQKWAK